MKNFYKLIRQLGKNTLLAVSLLIVFNSSAFSQIFIEAESYTTMEGVQHEGTSDEGGGENIGWIDDGDWLEYSINIPVSGDYQFSFRTASESGGGSISISSGGSSVGTTSVTSTGGWQSWTTITSGNITLSSGVQNIRLTASPGGFNLNWFELKIVNPVDGTAPTSPSITNQAADIHNISLSWSASTDAETAVAGYKIFNGDSFFAYTSNTTLTLSKLTPSTTYNFKIYAVDLAGNSSVPALVTISTSVPDWALVWSDEFDGTAVDETKWNYHIGPNNANNEEQYYTPDNASVADGKLTLSAKIESKDGYQYTSAKVFSQDKGDWLYKRIEVSAKLPSAGGTWPAIWMMPTESVYGGWPNSGEIDIMEHVGNNLGWVFGTVHTGAFNHMNGTQVGGGMTISDVHQNFHRYIIEWYPDRIDFYFDDIHYFTFENQFKTSAEWPYDQKFYLILNIAVGGDLGGNVNHNDTWPSNMEVDYVRVYDLDIGKDDKTPPTNPTSLNATPNSTSVDLNWTASTDDGYIEKYNIYINGVKTDETSGISYSATRLDPETEYTFGVQACDFGGNVSEIVNVTASTTALVSYAVPGIVEAENYLYMEGIDTENCTDDGGGLNIGWLDPNDWLEYSINVASAGSYYLETRTASDASGGSFELLDKDGNVLTSVTTQSTGGWQTWTTVSSDNFNLEAGIQTIKIKSTGKEFNINWFKFVEGTSSFDEIEKKSLNFYPNPLKGDDLNIEFNNKEKQVAINISTADGKTMFSRNYQNIQKIELDNLNLVTGLYILNIKSDTDSAKYKLIVE